MRFDDEQLDAIYKRTSGYCVHCQKKLARTNYGMPRTRGAWTVDHSRAQARGGTHHGNNLYASCIPCNSSKRDTPARQFRARLGHSGTPLSRQQVRQNREENRWTGRIIGAGVGLVTGGPVGAVIGALGGDEVGKAVSVDAKRKKPLRR